MTQVQYRHTLDRMKLELLQTIKERDRLRKLLESARSIMIGFQCEGVCLCGGLKSGSCVLCQCANEIEAALKKEVSGE